jgi:cysteine desulfurase family protein (TIGR01976 family)
MREALVSNMVVTPAFDVGRVRGLYPTLGSGPAALEGPFGARQPESVIRAVIGTLRGSPAQPGARTARSRSAAKVVGDARAAFADLVGGRAEYVYFGATLTALNSQFAEIVCWNWRLGDEIVLSRLDTSAIRGPWERAARSVGAGVRWAEVDLETGELPTWQYDRLIAPHTRLVTIALANPALGVIPDVRAITDLAHANGALVVLDCGAAVPHMPIDIVDLGVDAITVSAGSFGGPTVSALITRPGLLRELTYGTARVTASPEVGPLQVELLSGATAAIDHLAGLDLLARGNRRDRLVASIGAAGLHTSALFDYLEQGLRHQPHVTVLGSLEHRLPVLAFTVSRYTAEQAADALSRSGVAVWTGHTQVDSLLEAFGADEQGGANFVGLMPHTTSAEIDLLLDGLFAMRTNPRPTPA